MKRLTERIVSSGRSPASALARAPTITSPPGRKATAEGSSAAPVSGSGSTRAPPSSSTATRLFVVPRSMPMIGPTESFSHRVFDVAVQREPVAAPRHGVAERAVGAVHRRARCQRELALAGARGLEAVGVDRARGGMVAPLQVGQVERELARQAKDREEVSVRRQALDRRAARAYERRAALRVALPAFASGRLCCLHRSREASPDQTTNEEPQPQVRFTFGLRRLKPEAISSSL